MTEAELGVIGCVLIDNNSLDKIYTKLKPDMFSTEFCQDAYQQILAIYDRGENVNIMSLSQAMENHKHDPEQISTVLRDCLTSAPTSVMIGSYADTIIKEYRSREVASLFHHISLKPCDIDDTIGTILTRIELLKDNKQTNIKSMKQIVTENKDNYFNDQVGEGGVKTGFYNLDDCLGQLEAGDITVVGARPSVGKSAFVANIIDHMARKRNRVVYFNLEMNESQVYERFVSMLAKLSLTRVRRAKAFLGGEEESFKKANEELSDYDVDISTGSKTVSEIKVLCKNQSYDAIIIDYLQLIKADRKFANRSSEVGDISKSIKALAGELHVPVILLSQLNRVSEMKETKEPTMADLRESGDIEQDASNIILLWNVSEDRRHKGLKVDKCRQGELMKEGIDFDGDHMTFIESNEPFEKYRSRAIQQEKSRAEFNDAMDDFVSPF
jgi:replicative DNA helicase|uniref:DNA 5'-3' helicase n=1 Tax=virus sp. ctQ5V6 TaxID=2825815 RepID=A0A8S5RPT7_9VIRU|nr:MAG TPA: DnaB-like replicative helicase [virus sp. ctQ5V6]